MQSGGYVIMNYSRQAGSVYWQLHLSLPPRTGGTYEVRIEAFNEGATCQN
jgi:hypothetical protein